MRELLVALLALALVGGAAYLAAGCGGSSGSSDETSNAPALDRKAEAASRRFLDKYVAGDGRVQRLDQGGDTVGEGQAYGMLIAVAIGDQQRFDSIWNWAKDNIRRPDGLLSFLWKDGKVADPEAASDADVDATRALLAASCRFKKSGYKQEALDLGKAILDHETSSFQGSPVLVAGPWARKDPITLNPSYFSPATFAALGDATKDGRLGQPVGELALGHRPPDAELRQPAAGLGAGEGRQARAERPARQSQRAGAIRLRRAAHARAHGRGPRSGRAADRRQGVARVRGARAG